MRGLQFMRAGLPGRSLHHDGAGGYGFAADVMETENQPLSLDLAFQTTAGWFCV
jgi:hypothetical protein